MEGKIKIAVIGLGLRGYTMFKRAILPFDDIQVVGLCDVYKNRLQQASKLVDESKNGSFIATENYEDILKIEDLDAVFIMTGWEYHLPLAKKFMERGVYVAMEVGGGYSIEECQSLVETYEKTKTPCMMLENCCYDDAELSCLHAVRNGVFGKVVHCQGGYMHDLRDELAYGYKNGHYRIHYYLNNNCDNYPTHEIGPISKILNINYGNRFTKLFSVASKTEGLKQYIANEAKLDKSMLDLEIKQGDIVSTLIKCENGETVLIQLDTTLPRPYSRQFCVRGTKGMYQEDGDIAFFTHKVNGQDKSKFYKTAKKFKRKNKHDIQKIKNKAVIHGKMDTRVIRAFVEAVKRKENTPIDVYDAATWMVISYLSKISIETNKEVDLPDFTNGKYMQRACNLTNPYKLN